jgi:hypothetical protein
MAFQQRLPKLNTIQTVLQTLLLLHFADGEKRYIIAPEGLTQGCGN